MTFSRDIPTGEQPEKADADRMLVRVRRERHAREAAEALIESKSRELYAARLEAEMANRAKTEFLANMGHELRTPLNAVLGFAEVLEAEIVGPLNEKQTGYVRDIASSARRLIDVFNQVLAISRMDISEPQVSRDRVAVAPMIFSTLTALRERALAKDLVLSSDVGGDIVVSGDEVALRQIFGNIIGNAVKFTPSGGRVAVTSRADDETGFVDITVADTGIGIPEDQRVRVFAAFYQVSQGLSRRHEGAGLGLTVAKRLIELQGGNIAIDDNGDQGAEVRVRLPMAPPQKNKA